VTPPGVELHVQAEQLPVSDSHIRLLDKGLGRDGLFRAGVDWRVDGREIEALVLLSCTRLRRSQSFCNRLAGHQAHIRVWAVVHEPDTGRE
jgi:hypothetical protein